MVFSRREFLRLGGVLGLGLASPVKGVLPPSAQAALSLQLDWKYNVQFAGPLVADHRGLFSARGLDISIKPWTSGMLVTDVVAENPFTLGSAEQNLVLAAQAKGAPIRAVASMFQASPLALMTLPSSDISSLEDLRGKQVGVHVDGLEVMNLVLGVSGLGNKAIGVKQIPYEDKFERLLSGELAAIQCYAVDEPLSFESQTGVKPRLLKLHDYGYEAYAQVIFAHTSALERYPDDVKSLLEATFEGWRQALSDVPAAAAIVVDHYAEPGSKYQDLAYQTESLRLIEGYMLAGIDSSTLGSIDSARWMRMAQRFQDYGIIENSPTLEQSLAQGFWPPH